MAKKTNIDMLFPIAGLDKSLGYQRQPPYTTPDSLNVRPYDTMLGRNRGGSRPGYGKAFYQQIGGGANNVNMLGDVTFITTNGYQSWADNFSGAALANVWSAATWVGANLPGVTLSGAAYASIGGCVSELVPSTPQRKL